MATYHINKGVDNQFYWTFKASNGETILKSEQLTTKQNAENSIASSKQNTTDRNFEYKTAVNEQHYFVQKADNREPLAISETYTTTHNRDKGVDVVKKEAPSANTIDHTINQHAH